MDLTQYFFSLAALVPLVVLVTDFLIRWWKIESATLKQVIAWVTSVALCFVGFALNFGLFVNISIPAVIAYGFATGLIANGIFDIKIVQVLLDIILKFLPKKE